MARHVGYARDLGKHFEELLRREEELLAAKTRQQIDVWNRKADEVLNEVTGIKEVYRCELKKVCPDYFARMKLGEKLLNLSDKIKKQLDEENQGAVNSHFDSLATQRTVLQLISRIREKKDPKIGIFGRRGVGKTRVMQFVKHRPDVTTRFDFVIWVTVSKSQSIKKLQEQVQQCLSMKITSYESDEKVAEKIFRALLGKKYLLFLDDVRNMVDLGDLGFPNATTENGCQVVLTTATRSICWHMDTVFDIEVEGFTEEEAWDFVIHSLPLDVQASTSIENAKTKIVVMCSGLPLSLKIAAGIFEEWRFLSWRQVYDYDLIGFCFRRLEEIERLFLMHCVFYPEHHKIKKSRVINYMRACEYFIPYEDSLVKTHVDGDKIFDDLVKSSWLEKCDEGGHVTIPVTIRDLLKEKQIEQRVSSDLPTNLNENSRPVSLVLQGTSQLEPIPKSVFNNVPELQNLDLSGTNIKSLPDAISNMKRLRALFLKDCYFLETLPDKLGEVTTLEFLQVSGAWMPHLPLWIFNLQSLKFLKFGYRSIARWWSAPHHYGIGQKECELPSGSVSKLTKIEVFNVSNFMYNSRLSDGSLKTIAKELGFLKLLSSLDFVFPTIEDLENFLKSISWGDNVLKKFRFVVRKGNDFRTDIKRHKQCLKYNGGKGSDGSILPEAVHTVLTKSSFFELEKHEQIKCLSELGKEDTREVRHCGIYGCANLESVINGDDLVANIFENLESLTLSNLPKFSGFESFWDFGNPDSHTFANLRDVELQFCTTVREIFKTNQVVSKLNNLEELRIKSCPKLYHVISMDVLVWHWDLPRLKKVTLEDLPELQSILSDDLPHWDSLEEVCIFDCPRLEMLPFNTSNAKKLKKIKGSQKWWATALIWGEENKQLRKITESRFKSLFMEA